jgi:hypothetical protein
MRRAALLMLALLGAGPTAAQTREDLPRFVIDLHGARVGLPTAEGWVPAVSAETPLPGRAWGLAGGANVYLVRLGVVTFGAGAHVATGRGKAEALTITSGSGATATTTTTPVVITQITSLLPHLSMNFGHTLGWSYLSVGYGRTKVSSSSSTVGTTAGIVVPEAWNPALNFGGGAKWFMKPHLGASFDVRFTKLSSRGETATLPSARRTQMITFAVGISIQ